MSTNDDIRMAQVRAGENAVIERLKAKGLLPNEPQPATVEGEGDRLIQPKITYRCPNCHSVNDHKPNCPSNTCPHKREGFMEKDKETIAALVKALEALRVKVEQWAESEDSDGHTEIVNWPEMQVALALAGK